MQLTEDELTALIDRAAESGARRALVNIGLDDDHASTDIRDLRDWMKSWRLAKREAFKTAVNVLFTALIIAALAWVGIKVKGM